MLVMPLIWFPPESCGNAAATAAACAADAVASVALADAAWAACIHVVISVGGASVATNFLHDDSVNITTVINRKTLPFNKSAIFDAMSCISFM